MRNLKIEQYQVSTLPLMGILTHITELSRYNYIYVQHLMKEGDNLRIQRDYKRTWDNHSLAVYYREYKLGYLSNAINKIISKHFELQQEIKIVVKEGSFRANKTNMNLDVIIKIG